MFSAGPATSLPCLGQQCCGGNPLVLWLSAATALLVALGVLVNLDVLGRGVWSFAWRRVHLRRRARNRL